MKSFSRQLLSSGLVIALLFTLGCGGSDEPEEKPPENTPETKKEEAPKTTETKKEEAPKPDMSQPDVAVQALFKGMANGKPQVLWNGLPASYQNDINGIVQSLAGKMDSEVWDRGFQLTGRLASFLKANKERLLATQVAQQSQLKKEDAEKGLTHFAGIISAISKSELNSLESMSQFDGKNFTSKTGVEIFKHLLPLMDAANKKDGVKGGFTGKMKTAKITVENSEEDKATLKIVDNEEKTEMMELVKVEGKWIPADWAEKWKANIENARNQIDNISPDDIANQKDQILGTIGMVDNVLTGLEMAETQEDFDKALQSAVQPLVVFFLPQILPALPGNQPGLSPGGSGPKEPPPGYTPPEKKPETEKLEK